MTNFSKEIGVRRETYLYRYLEASVRLMVQRRMEEQRRIQIFLSAQKSEKSRSNWEGARGAKGGVGWDRMGSQVAAMGVG